MRTLLTHFTLAFLALTLLDSPTAASDDPIMDYILEADSVNTASGVDGLAEWVPGQPDLLGAAVARLIDLGIEVGDTGDAEGEAGNIALVEALASAAPGSVAPTLLAEYRAWDADARAERSRAGRMSEAGWELRSAHPDSALVLLETADAIYEKISDSHSRARVYGRMGAAHWYRGDVDGVAASYAEALRRRREVEDRMMEGATLNGLGTLHYGLLGENDVALDWYGQAIELRRAIGDQAGLARSLTYKANVHRDLGQVVEARALFEKARPALMQSGDVNSVVENIFGTAALYEVIGRNADALRLYQEALELCRSSSECSYGPVILIEQAELQRRVGMIHECQSTLEQAEALLRSAPDPALEVSLWMIRSKASSELGDRDAARDHLVRARQLALETGDLGLQCDIATFFSNLYLDLGAFDRARSSAEEALRLARELGDPAFERAALVALADVELRAGSADAAYRAFGAALELDEATGAKSRQADDLLGTGAALSLLNRSEEARIDLRRAARLLRESGEESALWIVYLNIADSFEEADADSAAYYYDAALASLEHSSESIGGEALNTGYLFADRGRAYEEIARYYAGRHREDPLGGWDAKAFETAERSRARGLLDLLEDSFALDAGPEALALIDSLYQVDTSTAEGRSRRDEINSRLSAMRAERRSNAVSSSLEPVALADLLKRKHSQTLILQYAVGDSATLMWVIDNKATELYELPGRDEMRRRVKAFRGAIAQPGAADDALLREGRALYQLLLEVAEDRINRRKNLVIVPDDVLFELPFSALIAADPLPGAAWSEQPFFGKKKRPAYAPSSTVYLMLREEDAGQFTRKLIAAGDVDYSGLDRELEPLPYTREEVERIPHKLKDDDKYVLLGDAATESTLKTALDLGSTRVVHLATHGLIDPAEPMRSSVALGAGRGEDGFLYSMEILSMQLDRPTIVLSACESALGRLEKGEGVVGLTRSFLAAGSRGVIASLWPVSDESTAMLMEEFYRALWQKYSAAESMRQARNALLATEEWSHPYFWAAFVAIGTEKIPW
jgi:CHAT domain-containing protein